MTGGAQPNLALGAAAIGQALYILAACVRELHQCFARALVVTGIQSTSDDRRGLGLAVGIEECTRANVVGKGRVSDLFVVAGLNLDARFNRSPIAREPGGKHRVAFRLGEFLAGTSVANRLTVAPRQRMTSSDHVLFCREVAAFEYANKRATRCGPSD